MGCLGAGGSRGEYRLTDGYSFDLTHRAHDLESLTGASPTVIWMAQCSRNVET